MNPLHWKKIKELSRKHLWLYMKQEGIFYIHILFFLAIDFCRFCVVIQFFHPRHNGQWSPTSKDFLTQILSITFIFLS